MRKVPPEQLKSYVDWSSALNRATKSNSPADKEQAKRLLHAFVKERGKSSKIKEDRNCPDPNNQGSDPELNKKPDPSKKKLKSTKFVNFEPSINNDEKDKNNLKEGKLPSQTQADYMVRMGIGEIEKIYWYRQAIMHPEKAMTNPMMRPYVGKVLAQVLDILLNDPQMWTRLRAILVRQHPNQTSETIPEAHTPAQAASRRSFHADKEKELRARANAHERKALGLIGKNRAGEDRHNSISDRHNRRADKHAKAWEIAHRIASEEVQDRKPFRSFQEAIKEGVLSKPVNDK